ncbi:MAG: hypothetical protein Q7S74_02625 [Nanoarchaeota archaeon]|nr:hypothetical protein [Nanoarchaeota archaeon]
MTYTIVEHSVKEHKYHTIQDNLTSQEIARFICEIQESEKYCLGQYGHVFIEHIDTVIGYIGDDRLDLVDSHERSFHSHQNSLIDILSKCLI